MKKQLTSDEQNLLERARIAAKLAYAPYSGYRVGAAVRTDAGVFTGCNVENASFGLAICAERAAIFRAIASGARRLEMIAVSCIDAAVNSSAAGKMPCGACRQVIAEFATPSAQVIVDGAGVWPIDVLLPEPFRLERDDTESARSS